MNLKRIRRHRSRGSALIEMAMSYAVLVIVALLSLRSSVNTTSGQAWTVKQTMSDAYIARESALASRLPFDTVVGAESPWARHPSVATSTVTIGRLPGGQAVTATLHRTRIPDANNLASAAGSGTSATNPSGTEAWQLQTVLAYDVGGRQYVKSRTVLRIR